MNMGEATTARPLLLLSAVLARLLWQNSSLSNENDVLATEFLFQFSNEASVDFLIRAQLRIGDENNNCLSSTHVDLPSSGDVQFSQRSFQITVDL